MRIIVIFDLPQTEQFEKKQYRNFHKFLQKQGYIMIQFSIYVKICIHAEIANRAITKLKLNSPASGDVRYMVVTEKQYQSLYSIQNKYSLQEKYINKNRILIIGGINENN